MFEIIELCEYREEIKKSKFFVLAQKVDSVQDALLFIKENEDLSASHNCWAYKIGSEYRFNDDGEPSGTAGKPIFSAIEQAGINNIAVLVIRWFGGTKLGTGGLCRAYGGTAGKCLSIARKIEIIDKVRVQIDAPFDLSSFLYRVIDSSVLPKLNETYTENGIELITEIPKKEYEAFKEKLINSTQAKVKIQIKNSS